MIFSLKTSGGELFKILFENIRSLDFLALKRTFHFCAHEEILDKSLLSYTDLLKFSNKSLMPYFVKRAAYV